MPDLDKLSEDYDRRRQKLEEAAARRIRKAYEASISEISINAAYVAKGLVPDKGFRIKDYPSLLKLVEREIQRLQATIFTTLVNSITDSWDLANQKNNVLVDKRLAGKRPAEAAEAILYDPNIEALQSFITRREKGITLSDRVWNTLDNFATEMEAAIGVNIGAQERALSVVGKGLSEGVSASKMATDIKQYLKEPDKLFRRVRGADGKLRLSKAAREYNPGRGVYRSSYQNALRLTRTETNMAYRNADHERWQKMGFIVGMEVKLSNNHPVYDICDEVKGRYPKDFKFSGWHPNCRCYAVPVQMSDEEYDKYEDALLAGEEPDVTSAEAVTDPPEGFTQWLKDNAERVEDWKSKPYWMKNNPKFIRHEVQ